MNDPDIFDHIVALVFGLFIPVLSGLRSAKAFKTLQLNAWQRKQFYLSNSLFLWIVTLVVLVNWWLHQRTGAALGILSLPLLNKTVILLTALFILLYLLDSLYTIRNKQEIEKIKEEWKLSAPFLPVLQSELPVYILMCLTAGICEEIIFRGFLVNYAQSLFAGMQGTIYWAVTVPAIVFAAAHYYQGIKAVLKIALLSILFGILFIRSGSLWIVILLHVGVDLFGGLLSIRYLDDDENKTPDDLEQPSGD
ncbi:MAG: CPBP family intramembrane metalloprotease [Terrimonas sp.]|nr:CPBP family intramembrane metalloprotease [Terrimonas sp.]